MTARNLLVELLVEELPPNALKKLGHLRKITEHGFGHTVMQESYNLLVIRSRQPVNAISNPAFDAFDRQQTTVPRDFARLR